MIRTVTGDINKPKFDAVLMHEHISCSSPSLLRGLGSWWLNQKKLKDVACETLTYMKQKYSLGLFVDGTPIDLGRNAALLREISEKTGVKIVASTGFYYLHSIETVNNEAEEIAKWLIYECENGIAGTDIKPGILKCATGPLGITSDNRKKLTALGIVQKETRLPLFVHCEHDGDIAYEQIKLLKESGASLSKTIIGHAAIRADADYLESIMELGCYVSIDQCFCYDRKIDEIADSIVKLCNKGYVDKILISNDYCIHSDFCKRDENGLHLSAQDHVKKLSNVFERLYNSYLSVGGRVEDWGRLISVNPLSALNV